MRTAIIAAGLTALCLSQATAAPSATDRGRVVLNCNLDPARKITACQVTRQTPSDIGLGDLATGWAIGKTIPAAPGAAPASGQASVIDLPLCFNITREPLQAQMDMAGACDAISPQRVAYGPEHVQSKPPGVQILTAVVASQVSTVVRREDMLRGGPSVLLGPPVSMRCSVLTTGALGCTASTQPKNAQLEAAALEAARQIRMQVRQVNGAPAAGTFNFTMRLD